MRKRSNRRAWGVGLAAIVAAGALSVAIAAPDVGKGEWVRYVDRDGEVVGYYAVHCDGRVESWGQTTGVPQYGVFLCLPIW